MSEGEGHPEEEQHHRIGDRTARGLLVEGLVIVASILLAFAIDAGWDQLREREQEHRLLAQLTDELNLFIDNLGPASQRISGRVDSDIALLLDFVHGATEPEPQAWSNALAWLHRAYEFSAATPVIDQLTGDGGLRLISDPAIRAELSNVSSFLGVVERFEELQGNFIADQMIPWLNRNVDRYAIAGGSGRHPEDDAESRFGTSPDVIRTREFSNLLIERRRLLSLVTQFRSQTLERMKLLRERVAEELED